MKRDNSWQSANIVLPPKANHLEAMIHRHTDASTKIELQTNEHSIPVDLKETDSEVTIFADMPGVDEDDIRLALEANILLIKAPREFDHDNEDADQYPLLERPYGQYERALNVPGNLDPSEMTARYRRGVLKVRIPKKVSQ